MLPDGALRRIPQVLHELQREVQLLEEAPEVPWERPEIPWDDTPIGFTTNTKEA